MARGLDTRASGLGEALSACRDLGGRRWAAAGLFVAAGVLAAGLMERFSSDELAPARVAVMHNDQLAAAAASADEIKEIERRLTAPNALRKTQYDLNLPELGISGDMRSDAFLASAISVSAADMPSVVDISVNTGDVRVDGMIANYLAGSLVSAQPATGATTDVRSANDAPVPSEAEVRYKLVAKARVTPGPSVLIYQFEALLLGLLSALSVLAFGVAQVLRRKAKTVAVSAAPKPVAPRGILEQIDMLERMWPDTGRGNPLPEGSNDEPEQVELVPARRIVLRMSELRQEAREAIEGPSEEALENVLTDMQSLRDHVRWITAEQLRIRRLGLR